MALELRQQLKLTQQLVMTPQLQQAIKLLQLSQLELMDAVQQELVENPALEEVPEDDNSDSATLDEPLETESSEPEESERVDASDSASDDEPRPVDEAQLDAGSAGDAEPSEPSAEDMVGDVDWDTYIESRPQTSPIQRDDDRPSLEDHLTPRITLVDHLLWQIGLSDFSEHEAEVAQFIVGNLNEDGYLEEKIEGIAEAADVAVEFAEAVLKRVQHLDPVGVATRDLRECLLLQAGVRGISDRLVLAILRDHLDLLERKDYRAIARIEGCTVQDVADAATSIGRLEPRPGREFAEDEPIYITPDIYVHKIGDEYHVVLNEDGVPKLKVSAMYRQVLANKEGQSKETRDYVREKLRSAVWLIKSIHQRQRTIVKVMQSILRFQRDFFDKGAEYLRPLNLRDVAEDIEMHESTVSRVTTNKYVQCPHGIYELKFFFNSSIRTSDGDSIASESVKEKIREIIRSEDPYHPLSDQRIAEELSRDSIQIARRTVTKYRESLKILSSTRRRKIG